MSEKQYEIEGLVSGISGKNSKMKITILGAGNCYIKRNDNTYNILWAVDPKTKTSQILEVSQEFGISDIDAEVIRHAFLNQTKLCFVVSEEERSLEITEVKHAS